MQEQRDLIFALDIGTRTVIGLVIEYREGVYQILASHVEEHEERAMLDGQIHNVQKVAKLVQKVKEVLESKLNLKLKRVAIAAAGRALKTLNYQNTIQFEAKKMITKEDVQGLEYGAVQKAQAELAQEEGIAASNYHFVGYSVMEYQLDGIVIGELVGQQGKTIQVSLIATFLPRIVIDSLLTVVEKAGLEVNFLTLEPIAAANLVIPKNMSNFNLALIDIGAGTSDIALTKGGAMIGYAMVPIAGDEITEALAEHYLLDYHEGERVKRWLSSAENELLIRNILSQEISVSKAEAIKAMQGIVDELAGQIAKAILEINGGRPPQAVICIGGGSLTPGLLPRLAEFLDLDQRRIGIRESKDLTQIKGKISGISDAQTITPLAIAFSSRQDKFRGKFLEVKVNHRTVQLFSLNEATVIDALLAAEVDPKQLWGKPGLGLTCNVNGEMKVIKGTLGKAGKILLNGAEVSLDAKLFNGDEVEFIPGENGEDAKALIADVVPKIRKYSLYINGSNVELPAKIYQNGKLVEETAPLKDGADIRVEELKTIADAVAHLAGLEPSNLSNEFISFTVNGQAIYRPKGDLLVLLAGKPAELTAPLQDGLALEIINKEKEVYQVRDFIPEAKLSIWINNSQLEVPAKLLIKVNGQEVDLDYQLQAGDELFFEFRPLKVKDILNYINYQPSAAFEQFSLTINDTRADLEKTVKDGDNLVITLGEAGMDEAVKN